MDYISEVFSNMSMGFQLMADPIILLYCFAGVVLGAFIGALPGLGPSCGIAILLPATYGMDPTSGIIMLCGIYYGAMYGGSITAILINVPGDAASVCTTLDGYPMARRGEGGKALGMSAFSSFIAGTIGTIMFMFLAPFIAKYALTFGASEFFALMLLGLTSVAGMAGKSLSKAFLAALMGLFISVIGLDLITGQQRFVFGNVNLYSGIDFIPLAMGVFGMTELMLTSKADEIHIDVDKATLKIRNLFPNKKEWKICMPHIMSGTFLGFGLGMIPGNGATVASFLAYDLAKRTSHRGKEFGTGCIEGVAAPEAANNSAVSGALIPMLTLGVPGSAATAVLMGALMMMNVTPGPFLFSDHPETAWGLIASMYIGNIIMVVLACVCLGLFVKILNVKPHTLNAVVLAFILIGAYTLQNSMFTVGLTVFFSVLGYFMKKLGVPAAPMVLALVLGALTESSLRRALIIADSNFLNMLSRPITAVILVLVVLMAFSAPLKNLFLNRKNKNAVHF